MRMREYHKTDIKDSRIEITAANGGLVTIASQIFEVFDKDGASIQDESPASINGNGTASVEIYGLVDATADGFTVGSGYYVQFIFTIGSEQLTKRAWFRVIR